ncbi:MAG: sensor histidine kinase [Syntrophales bacterium]|nr:sensor histidine kinase [Syntrophales bacterium]
MKFLRRIIPDYWADEGKSEGGRFRYRRLWKYLVSLTALVSLAPLVIMTAVNYYQYQKVLRVEMIHPISQLASNTKRSLESFIEERISALNLIIHDKSFEDIADQKRFIAVFRNMKNSFGGFVDLGLIDAEGYQRSYVGPYELKGKNYKDQDWFHEVSLRGVYVSDVFMGYRNFPHFVIAVKNERAGGDFYVLRATVDTETPIRKIISPLDLRPSTDVFLINRKGILQTSSRFYGRILEKMSLAVPPFSSRTEVLEEQTREGQSYILGYAYIERTPFILMIVAQPKALMENWLSVRRDLVWFLIGSIVIILLVILWSSTYMVNRVREADLKRAALLHSVEYTNKMASIGRLAAGVAHEINNPLAIINEKAGLVKDIAALTTEDFPQREKIIKLIESILVNVERCSTITHRLLGFAKRMDVHLETINLELLIKEVLSFLEKEATYRDISVNFHIPENFPSIQSDRGQLQQVFLNIINNAFAAVEDRGRIDISIREDKDTVAVTISDNGHGISEEDLQRIFEPFFTTKKEGGVGLGLSITYGIVEKLGGRISVESKVGQGTSFTVILPAKRTRF